MKTTLLTLALAAITTTSALRAEDPIHPPINPALLYWQAASELPTLTDEQAKDLRAMATGKVAFDAARARKLQIDGCLHLLEKAANSPAPCDWGMPTEDGPAMPLPHVSKLQELSSIAILEAELAFADGKTKEGLDWLLITHRIARHAGAGDMLISNLVQFVIETNALGAAARHCLAWDEETRHSYAAMLQTLPPLHTTQAAYQGERILIDWIERKFNGLPETKLETEKLLTQMISESKAADKEALAADFKPEALHAALAELRSLQNRTQDAAGKAWPQAQPELSALDVEASHSTHCLVRLTYPALGSVAERQYAVATMRTMLDAALEHGRQLDATAVGAYHDAFDGQPLLVKKSDNGALTLVSSHKTKGGKDVNLDFGK